MSSWAMPGVKVVCINNVPKKLMFTDGVRRFVENWRSPVLGGVYTIKQVVSHTHEGLGLLLEEIDSGVISNKGNVLAYAVWRFRPLITKTQSEDIEMFLRIASKAPSNMESTDA